MMLTYLIRAPKSENGRLSSCCLVFRSHGFYILYDRLLWVAGVALQALLTFRLHRRLSGRLFKKLKAVGKD